MTLGSSNIFDLHVVIIHRVLSSAAVEGAGMCRQVLSARCMMGN